MKLKCPSLTLGFFLLLLTFGLPQANAFVHPGAPLTSDDLAAVKANLNAQPWKSGYAVLAADGHSQLTYVMRGPYARVSRQGSYDTYLNAWRSDMIAIWNLSRMGYFTGNPAYSQKAHDILLAWANTQIEFSGRESMLDLGDYAYRFVGGAEILRGTWSGWTDADTATVKAYFGNILLPATNPYGESQYGAANKGALALVAGGLLAIFDDDTAKLDTIVYQVRSLAHIGLRSSDDIGLLGDSLRDQGHAHGQLFSLAMLAEALWKQGIDIYSEYDNRLLSAAERFGRINALVPTTFLPFGTTDAYYIADNTNRGWGGGNVMFNLIHGAYVVRKGLPAPWTIFRRPVMPVDGDSFVFAKVADSSVATPPPALAIPTTSSLTSGFTDVEIGGAAPAGTASYSGGMWTVQGGGSEMWGTTNDSCHFAYQALTGDCAIVAKVSSVGNTSLSAKAGVMMRTSLSQGAPRAWMAVTPRITCEQNIQGLTVYGGTNYSNKVLNIASSTPSYWVKLERIGNIITGYISPDGTNWAATDVGRLDAAPDTIYVGLVVCSLANGTLNTSTFNNVQITGGDGGAPVVVPAAPAALLASSGEYVVPLRWQSSFGATSYTVQRSTTSGGPYVTVASGITAASYEDWTVTNGTTYYYVVTASNSTGTSPNSVEDHATPALLMMNVATGGTSLASSNTTSTNEGPDQAFDTNPGSKWYGYTAPTGWIQYDLGAGNEQAVKRYSIISADVATRDPKTWTFLGSQDGVSWTTLDSQSNQSFALRLQMNTYDIGNTTAYRFYRLSVTANNGATGLAIAELGLWADKAPAAVVLGNLNPTYDGAPKPASASVTPGTLPVAIRYDGRSTAPTNAGSYAVLATVTDPRYAGSATGTLTIAPATLTLTADPQTKIYGSADPALTFAVSGLQAGDTAAAVVKGAPARSAGENAGSYPIGQGTLAATANYAVNFVAATFTIAPKPASVTPDAVTKVYGAADPALTGTLTGFLPADNVTAAYARPAGENVADGPYLISAVLGASGLLSNYAVTSNTAPFTITPAPLAIVANAERKVYGSVDPSLTYAVTGLQFSDTAGGVLTGALSRVAGENVNGSPYAIQQGTLAANANYVLGYTGANLVITPATATVVAKGFTGTYDGKAHGVTGTAIGANGTDVSGMLDLGASYTIVPGGTANWTFHDPVGNYTDQNGSAQIAINQAAPTIVVTPYTVTYDGNAHTATSTITGVSGETLAGLDLSATTHTAAGSYTDAWTFTDTTGNYLNQSGTVIDSIAKAAASIAVTPYSVTFDGAAHSATGTATGVKGEALAGLDLGGTVHTKAGTYSTDAWAFTDATGNYGNAHATITDQIAKAPVTIALAPLAQMYDGTPKPVTATTTESPAASSLPVTITYNDSSEAPTLPGSYSVVATVVDPNYAGTLAATETVGITALVRHGLSLDGEIDGSVQVMLAENDKLNGHGLISGDLLVPGTPTVRINGHPTYGSTVDYAGSATPSNYTVTLNGEAVLRHVGRRVDGLTLPVVEAPPHPSGTRNVTLDEENANAGDFATINNLTFHGDDKSSLAIPPGTYGTLAADGEGTIVLGVAGTTTPAVYNFQGLVLNDHCQVQIAGPVVITVATAVGLNGAIGNPAHPEWLTLRVASGGVTLNGEATVHGAIIAPASAAPAGTVTINGDGGITGGVVADRLVVNGNGYLAQPGIAKPKAGTDHDQ